jgi:LysM repeat protein
MRSTVPFEIKAFATGAGGALSIPAIYNYLTSEKKQSMRKMAEAMDMKLKPKPKKKVSNVGKNPPMSAGIKTISIKKGDTLSAIARKNNTTVSTLKKLNPNVKPREMKIGGSLKIPRTGGTR